jgi:imidazolonepropionase
MLREAGTAIAIATDFNPGSCTLDNLPMIASLSALYCGTNLAETIAGVTFRVYDTFTSVEEWLADFGKTKPKQVMIRGKQVI